MYPLLPRTVTVSTLLQLVCELAALFAAAAIAIGHVHEWRAATTSALVFALVLVALNAAFGIYRRAERLTSGPYVLRMLLAASIGLPLAFAIDAALPGGGSIGRNAGLAAGVALGLLFLRHGVVLPMVSRIAPHRVLILGTGAQAQEVAAALDAAGSPGLSLAGFYPLQGGEAPCMVPRGRVFGAQRALIDVVREQRIGEIVVAVREQRGGVVPLRALLDCRLAGVRVTDLARFYELSHGCLPLGLVKASWLIYADGFRQHLFRASVKRAFDVAVASALLVLTLPLMIAAAAAIAIESGRPILYTQLRVGRGGRPFTVFKFRSMRLDAERGEAKWAAINDTRVTRVGAWLRRARIDELPQLVNVLRGEMSFVGPRPERPEFVEMLSREIPFYAARFSVKPGLTGWAQVRYCYGADIEQASRKLEYDLYYVKNHTLALDLLILLETIRVVLLGEGAR
jgi:sugar transferase (PEP-CTERM system associated)